MKRKKFNTIYFLLASMTIVLMCSCKDKEPNSEYYKIRMSNEVKSYLWSNVGSYWIYKNTKNNELDTQQCISFKYDSLITKGTESYSKHITLEYDRIRKYIYSSYNKWTIFDNTGHYTPDSRYFNNGRTILDRNISGEGIIVPFFHHFSTEGGSGTGSSFTKFITKDTALTIQNKIYHDVVKFEIDIDSQWENTPPYTSSIYFWAKNVGLVKKKNKIENYSWELIDHRIIK